MNNMSKRFEGGAYARAPLESDDTGSDPQYVIHHPYFDSEIIVTRNTTGEVVSRYKDTSWDYRAQAIDASSAQTIHFWRAPKFSTDHTLAQLIYEQQKALIWVIDDFGDIKTFHTLYAHAATAQYFCTIAYNKGVDLFTLLIDIDEISRICEGLNVSSLSSISILIQTLWRHRDLLLPTGAQMQRDKIMQKIRSVQSQLPETKQTPLIPSRIYCSVLGGLLEGLDVIEREIDVVLNAFQGSVMSSRKIKRDSPNITSYHLQLSRKIMLADNLEQMLSVGFKKSIGRNVQTFCQRKIVNYQIHLMHTVVALSGMRVGEAKILPLDGAVETFTHKGKNHYVIKGYTRKLHRGVKTATEWITIDEGHRAILLAARISQVILSLHDKQPQKGQMALLFPSMFNPFKMITSTPFLTSQKILNNAICPAITTDDIDELNQLELQRDWDRNRIEVGKRWPLAMHQLRRSLSVYAHRSGMVTLPALKAQLQHITDEMRAYYSDGWSRAVNLVFDKNHFSHEWNAAKTESTYFGLTGALKIAFDKGELLGLGAQRLGNIISTRSRQQTMELIKDGTIAYRETVLGGCTSTEVCRVMPLHPINFECVVSNCANLVVYNKRLDFVIRTQESVVEQLNRDEVGSVAQRLEAEHLKRLLVARDQLRKANI